MAAHFGIAEQGVDAVVAWADQNFDKTFGPWTVFFNLEDARATARSFLSAAPALQLWGLGLHCTLVKDRDRRTKANEAPLASGGTKLGFEILIDEHDTFDSPESATSTRPRCSPLPA